MIALKNGELVKALPGKSNDITLYNGELWNIFWKLVVSGGEEENIVSSDSIGLYSTEIYSLSTSADIFEGIILTLTKDIDVSVNTSCSDSLLLDLGEIASKEDNEVFISSSDKLITSLSKISVIISTDSREDSGTISLTESLEIRGDSKCSEETILGVTESAVVGISISTFELIPLSIEESSSVVSTDSGEDSCSILLMEIFEIGADFKCSEEIDLGIIESAVIGISISASELIGLNIEEFTVANINIFAQDSDNLSVSETISINKSLLMSDALTISTGTVYSLNTQNGAIDELSFVITEKAELDTVFVNVISEDSLIFGCEDKGIYRVEITDEDALNITSTELNIENSVTAFNSDSIILSLGEFISINTRLLSSDNVILNMEDIGLLSFDTPRGDFLQIVVTEEGLLSTETPGKDGLNIKLGELHKIDISQETGINIGFDEICILDTFQETGDYIDLSIQEDGSVLGKLESIDYGVIFVFEEGKGLITLSYGNDINVISLTEINILDKDLDLIDNLNFNIIEESYVFRPEGVIYVEDTFKIGLDRWIHPMNIGFTDELAIFLSATPYVRKPGMIILISYSERFTRLSMDERIIRLGVTDYGG